MWYREFRDYPPDSPLKQERVEPGKGIVGCEMHEHFGWGQAFHQHPPRKRGLLARLLGGGGAQKKVTIRGISICGIIVARSVGGFLRAACLTSTRWGSM